MPTPLDRAMQSRNAFLAFAGMITAVSVWSIWGGELFPGEKDPTGDPSKWADSELKRWLEILTILALKRGLLPDKKATRDDLLERVKANMKPPPRT